MAQRTEASDSLDDFPTPPWATRALLQHAIPAQDRQSISEMRCLEPACGAGHMSKVLSEFFKEVHSSDVADYGYGETKDFLTHPFPTDYYDWIITNPPFKVGEEFVLRSLPLAKIGVAILARTVFLESIGRYKNLFLRQPPSFFAQFSERVPMVKGRLDKNATTATGYGWLVWTKDPVATSTQLVWIPPCRRELERANDYELPDRP